MNGQNLPMGQKCKSCLTTPLPPPLPPEGIKYVQTLTGLLLYCSRTIDYTILPVLQEIASKQAHPTERTRTKCNRLLDYIAT